MFFVCDENYNELDGTIYGNVWFTTCKQAESCAKRLSKKFPNKIFGISCCSSSVQFLNGSEVD